MSLIIMVAVYIAHTHTIACCVLQMPLGQSGVKRALGLDRSRSPRGNVGRCHVPSGLGARQRLGLQPPKRELAHLEPEAASSGSPRVDSARSWRGYVAKTFLSNKLSAYETQVMVAAASNAGASGAEDVAQAGLNGKHKKNLARDITRSLLKGITFPEPYMAKIPVWDPKAEQPCVEEYPFLLPHEFLHFLTQQKTTGSTVKSMGDVSHRVDQNLEHEKIKFCRAFHLDYATCIPIGFHGDGVPHQKGTYNKGSTEVYSWNLLSNPEGERFLFTTIPKKFFVLLWMSWETHY
jgi:hypothetical protein